MKALAFAALLVVGARALSAPQPSDDFAPLTGFKTYNGKPLVELLHSYGIHVASSEASPAEAYLPVADRTGLMLYVIEFSSGPTRKMPCRLNEWFKGEVLPTSEFQRRGAAFPLIDPSQDDPLIYWAATGKCSKAYSF